MKLALLCRNPKLYSHRRLVEAAEERGHSMDVIDHLRCLIDISSRLLPTLIRILRSHTLYVLGQEQIHIGFGEFQ